MDLITDPQDERLGNEIVSILTPQLLIDSLRAALTRCEDAEAALCRAREALHPYPEDAVPPDDEYERGYDKGTKYARKRVADALSSSSPCPHEEEAKRLREAVEWACETYGPSSFTDELRRRAGREDER